MKITDLKFLLPRIKYSKHTPKTKPISQDYFMQESPLNDCKPKILNAPQKDEYVKNLHRAQMG